MRNIYHFIIYVGTIMIIISCKPSTNKNNTVIDEISNHADSSLDVEKSDKEDIQNRDMIVMEQYANALHESGYEKLQLKNWNTTYKNNAQSDYSDEFDYLIRLNTDTKFKAFSNAKKTSERKEYEVDFKNVKIIAFVARRITDASMKNDFKVIQFWFTDSILASEALLKFKDISRYALDGRGLYSKNKYWQYKNRIYFCRTRAAAFSVEPAIDIFEQIYDEVEILPN